MRNFHHKLFHPQKCEEHIWMEKAGKIVRLMQVGLSELCTWIPWSQFLKDSLS